MEIITFFSFKGGVGRTQCLLNTACEFAQRGKKVLLLDFDLHAPGLSLMECLRPRKAEAAAQPPGTLDFFEWLLLLDAALRRGETDSLPAPINLAACAYEPPVINAKLQVGAGFLKLVPAANLSHECEDAKAYSDRVHAVDSPLTEVIRRTHRNEALNPVIEQIRSQFFSLPDKDRPDAIFIDARTGITGIADLLLTRSSDRIVLVTGLNEQNLWGLESTLLDIERAVKTDDWLRRISIVISPVPQGEHALTEERIAKISKMLSRHVDEGERTMFGEVGLLPEPVQIPYDAQLSLVEDPILLRHENSVPAARYRELADRLGGKMEPLQFKATEVESLPLEHPLTKPLPWSVGLTSASAQSVKKTLRPESQPDKPYKGWMKHVLNYWANSVGHAGAEEKNRRSSIRELAQTPVAHRLALLRNFREYRQQLFALPKSEWPELARALGEWRVSWLTDLPGVPAGTAMNWLDLARKAGSATSWGTYWTGLGEALRKRGHRDEAVELLRIAPREFCSQPGFGIDALHILNQANAYEQAVSLADQCLELMPTAPLEVAMIFLLKAQALSWMNQIEAGLASVNQSEQIFRSQNNRVGLADALQWGAQLLMSTGRLEEARMRYEDALVIYRESKERFDEANTLQALGDVLLRIGSLDEARVLYDEALVIYRKIKNRLGEANTLRSLGDLLLLLRTGSLDEARGRYDEALVIYRELQNRLGEGNTLKALGDLLLLRIGSLEEARVRYEEALVIFRDSRNRLNEANTLKALGDLLPRIGRVEEARARYEEALVIFRELHSRLGVGNALQGLGDLLLRTDRLDEALGRYEEAVAICREIEDRLGEGCALQGLGEVLMRTDKLAEARVRYDEALVIFRELHSRHGEGNTLKALGELLVRTGRLDEARERYDEALVIYREIANRRGEGNTLKALGELLVRTDRLDEARERYEEALVIFRELHSRLGEGNTLRSLGELLLRTDRLEEARGRYEEALVIYRELHSRRGEGNTLRSLGDLLLRIGSLEEARVRYDEALVIFRESRNRLNEANTLQALGDVLLRTHRLDEARRRYDEAVAIFRELHSRLGEGNTLLGLGRWHLARGEHDACRGCLEHGLRLYAELSDSEGRWETLLAQAQLEAAQEQREKAVAIAQGVAAEARVKGFHLLAREAREWLAKLP